QTLHEIEVPEYNGQADVWERHVLEVGGATMALHASWTREFGAWETFPVTDEMISIADGAAQSWAAIANNFRQRKQSDDCPWRGRRQPCCSRRTAKRNHRIPTITAIARSMVSCFGLPAGSRPPRPARNT